MNDIIEFYHGTSDLFNKIDVSKGKGHKDFGKGFYFTTLEQQAISWAKTKQKFNYSFFKQGGTAYIYKFKLDLSETKIKNLNIKKFFLDTKESKLEWIDFIIMCRLSNETPHNYDLVIGPTTDSDTKRLIQDFLEKENKNTENYNSLKLELIKELKPENLKNQYFISKQEILDYLIIPGSLRAYTR